MTDTQPALLKRTMDALEEVFFVFTPEGKILEWNRPLIEETGYTDEEIKEMHPIDFVPGEEKELVRRHIAKVLEDGQTRLEARFLTKQGQEIPYEFTASLIEQDGEALICGTGRNITEREQAEKELEVSNQALSEQAEQIKKQNALLELTEEVASAANEAESFEEALQTAVDAVCELTGWPVGHVYVPTGAPSAGDVPLTAPAREEAIDEEPAGEGRAIEELVGEERGWIVPAAIWNQGISARFEAFQEATKQATFQLGESLPGRILKTGGPAWIENAIEEPTFKRTEVAAEVGLRAAFAFPVLLDGEIVAVLEFFSEEAIPADEAFLEVMESVGVQLGRVAERMEAKRNLEVSERRYRSLFEDSQEGIAITTPEGEIVEANPAALEIFGCSREELLSMNAAELYANPEERKAAARELEEKGTLEGRELRLRRAGGEEIVCRLSATIRYGEDEAPESFQTFFRDVTERKEAEKALKESEEKFRKLAENALVGIGLIQDGTYKYLNPELARITGYARDELLGKSPKLFVHPDDWPRVKKQLQRRLEEKEKEVFYETRIRTKSGATREVEVAGALIDHQGKPAVIGTIQDVTEQRRLQRDMLQVQEEERRQIGEDLHDGVASQLSGATLRLKALSAMLQDEEAKENVQEVEEIIQESAGNVRKLSRGLSPGGLSEGALPSALAGLAESSEGARFENVLQAGRPGSEGVEDETLSTLEGETATHLYRIAQEAVLNARRHGKAEEIAIRLRKENGTLVLEVEDDGKGFEPSEAGKEGLGLRSMQHRAELLGAELSLESSPGEGTLVRCRMPL